jgi:hypothetical protein
MTSSSSTPPYILSGPVHVEGDLFIFYDAGVAPIPPGQTRLLALSSDGRVAHVDISPDTLKDTIANVGQPNGIATLDGFGNVPVGQLGNVAATAVVADHEARIQSLESTTLPWDQPAWNTELAAQRQVEVPIYTSAIVGGGNLTYFATMQPYVIEIVFTCTCNLSLVVDPGQQTLNPISGSYELGTGTHSILLPAPSFTPRTVPTGTYSDRWDGGNALFLPADTNALCCYVGVGFPSGPLAYPAGSPFGVGYTLAGSPYLDSDAPIRIRGWRSAP